MKLYKLILSSFLVFILAACTNKTPDIIPNDYDPRSLVPDRCEHLENIDDWQPVWCDEFDEDGHPNPDLWGYDIGGGGWGNNELQYYTNALNNAFVEDGVLTIRAIPETMGGREYTSARLVSKYRGDWLYGRIQVMAKMPSGKGTWPAIWMLPTDWVYGNWPHSGEIDIMEYVGYDPGIVHGTIHTGAYNHNLGTQLGYRRTVPTVETEFHLYEMIWEPGRIELFIDGERFAIFGYNPDLNRNIANSAAWPFDERFHLILNLAVGGDWGGARGIDSDAFPTEMQIEFVRVFQKDYAGLDQSPPEMITGLVEQFTTHNSARFKWTHALDDVMVSHYNIYSNGELNGSTTVNGFLVTGLASGSTHVIEVEAVDFAGNSSPKRAISIETKPVREVTTRIQAEDYDAMQGVQTQPTTDIGGGENVAWIDTGDYLEYILEVKEAGQYVINYRIASETAGGEITMTHINRFATVVTSFDATGGWQTWETVTSDTFNLNPGIYTFRFTASQGGFNLNHFEFEKVGE
ncbi:carbohydrate-binding protein [Liberiplasma polymorphum]|uniref:carbohydrate-binding protein n=1 Tax=Liberiplasma polymorphum TaxID=3374570 RepID=UPI003774E07E